MPTHAPSEAGVTAIASIVPATSTGTAPPSRTVA